MTLRIGMLVFPELTQLDLTGPYEFFHRLPEAEVHLLWKDRGAVRAQGGLAIVPTTTLSACPPLDILFVPGGFGHIELTNDDDVLGFLAAQGRSARYVTSVCTGSLLLGAAGLLEGYEASTHWAYMKFLPAFGARPVRARVVVDRNRITAGGVTSGIDFGLRITSELFGPELAQALQLGLEYDPEPPFRSGHPDVADPALVAEVQRRFTRSHEALAAQIDRWTARSPRGGASRGNAAIPVPDRP
jgi:cyclohexyl-isocyanide hydratase